MAKDYSYLEGKEFDIDTGFTILRGKVIYADYHIGITCVNVEDHEEYILCLVGPYAPNYKPIPKRAYKSIWQSVVKQIEGGFVSAGKTLDVYEKHTNTSRFWCSNPSSEFCAFSQ